jgi:hypothetical protein
MIDFPASPIDGQLFSGSNGVLYKYSSTHTAWLSSTANISNIGSAFSGQLTANQAVGSASTVTVAGYTEYYDNENTFNPATGVWTPTTGGVYRVSGFAAMSAGAACSVQLLVRGGGVDLAGCDSTIGGASLSISMSFSTVFRLNAGTALDLRARTVSPVAATILSAQFTGFNATYVGP